VDSGVFKGSSEIQRLEERTAGELQRYVDWCGAHGFPAVSRLAMDTETIPALDELCHQVSREFPRAIFFTGKLIFKEDKFTQRLLHNDTAFAIQRRLQFSGLQTVVLPIRAT